jgi:hypothetical protein
LFPLSFITCKLSYRFLPGSMNNSQPFSVTRTRQCCIGGPTGAEPGEGGGTEAEGEGGGATKEMASKPR